MDRYNFDVDCHLMFGFYVFPVGTRELYTLFLRRTDFIEKHNRDGFSQRRDDVRSTQSVAVGLPRV